MDATAMEGAAYNKANSSDQFGPPAGVLVKGKRTKRQRTVVVGPASSSASSTEVSGSSTTEEEEDMAHCLILLAQGGHALDLGREDHLKAVAAEEEAGTGEKFAGRKAADFVYECKTCSKCFPSFQALGGHRTSHKKPKTAILAESKRPVAEQDAGPQVPANSSIPKPIAPPPSKPRMHECMICGSEFSSGQALGGHMRRHRPLAPAEVKKDKAVFVLDLNLPAPPDGDLEELPKSPAAGAAAAAMAFTFESQQSLVF